MTTKPGNGSIERMAAAALAVPFRIVRWCFSSRWRVLTVTLVFFGLLTSGGFEAYDYWSSPDFCQSCHYMDPYHASWEASTHNGVKCVDCHFEPGLHNELHGKWLAIKQLASAVTGAYSSMPYAEVSDSSCLRGGCHATADLDKPVEFSKRKIPFNHADHLGEMRRGIKLACTSCHNQTVRSVHMEVDVSACFLCHFKDTDPQAETTDDCEKCHGPPKTELKVDGMTIDHQSFVDRGMRCADCHRNTTSAGDKVGEARCLSCHNQREQLDKIGDIGLLHVEHVTRRKLHCYQCHEVVQHRFVRPHPAPASAACGSCHDGSHQPQALMLAGQGATSGAGKPDPMYRAGLDCVACHGNGHGASGTNGYDHRTHHTPADAAANAKAACSRCHGDRFGNFAAVAKTGFAKMSSYLHGRLDRAWKAMDHRHDEGHEVPRETYRTIDRARRDLDFVSRAGPLHNPFYALQILRKTDLALADVEDVLEVPAGDGEIPLGFEVEDCRVCHDGLPMPGTLKLSGDREYPHAKHVEKTGMGCADCHTTGETHPYRAPSTEGTCKACHKDK